MNQVEKSVLLQTLDKLWREHIVTVDYLRQVIHLRGYGQRDPLNEYKTESFNLFSGLLTSLKAAVVSQLMRVEVQTRPDGDGLPDEDDLPEMTAHHIDLTSGEDDVGEGLPKLDVKNPESWGKVGRNDMCPCGSGKRYKHCHGAYV